MKRVFLSCLLALFAVCAYPVIHKCKDPNGQMRYSDRICSATGSEDMDAPKKILPSKPRPTDAAGGENAAAAKASAPAQPVGAAKPAQPIAPEKPASGGIIAKILSLFSFSKKKPDIPAEGVAKKPEIPMAGAPAPTVEIPALRARCKSKTHCAQVASCEEALQLMHCPDNKLDEDGNGVPCEETLCK